MFYNLQRGFIKVSKAKIIFAISSPFYDACLHVFPKHSLNARLFHKTRNDTEQHCRGNAWIPHGRKPWSDLEPGTCTQSRRKAQTQETSQFSIEYPFL